MTDKRPAWAPESVDLDRPNAARVYDYLLGGACNFEPDRAFLGRAVQFCVSEGIRQFLDLGSGIPTVGNVHEIAQRADPSCRVVYVDNEPIAVAHSELMLERNERAAVLQANLLDPDTVLNSLPVRQLLDFSQPIAVLMAAVLHFVPDSANPNGAVARYVNLMAPGSCLVLSHVAKVKLQRSQDAWRMYDQSTTPGGGRSRAEVGMFMAGTELVDPGIVWTPQWRQEPGIEVDHPELAMVYAAVGRKP